MDNASQPLTLIERLLAHTGLLSRQQLADLLGWKSGTLAARAYLKKGPPMTKVGAHARYDPVEVARWLEAQQVEQAEPAPAPVPKAPSVLPPWLQRGQV